MHAEIKVQIAAPPARVWQVMSDVERWAEWTASVNSIKRLDHGPLRVGSQAVVRQPKLPPTRWTVTEVLEVSSFTWVAAGPGFRTVAIHRVEPGGSGSIATLTLDQTGPLGTLVGKLTAGLTDRYLKMEAAGLRATSEQPAA